MLTKSIRKTEDTYEGNLADFFYEVAHFGASTMRTALMMRWMGWDKQAAGFWEEVQERCQNALQKHEREEGWRFFTVQNEGQITIMCFYPENADADGRWWTPIQELAEKQSPGRRRTKIEQVD
jgi:hypothetical protein